jgi:hypothetical protein
VVKGARRGVMQRGVGKTAVVTTLAAVSLLSGCSSKPVGPFATVPVAPSLPAAIPTAQIPTTPPATTLLPTTLQLIPTTQQAGVSTLPPQPTADQSLKPSVAPVATFAPNSVEALIASIVLASEGEYERQRATGIFDATLLTGYSPGYAKATQGVFDETKGTRTDTTNQRYVIEQVGVGDFSAIALLCGSRNIALFNTNSTPDPADDQLIDSSDQFVAQQIRLANESGRWLIVSSEPGTCSTNTKSTDKP